VDETSTELPINWRPGSVIAGRFRVLRVLGIGGMGAVLEAENTSLGQRIALKVLRRELVGSREAQVRFDQEARAVSQLHTDHVARVHDLGKTEENEPFIVMELLDGYTLDTPIDSPEQTPISLAIDLAAEACVGLAVAHAAGMVHRDIKPGNLFVTRRADGSEIVKVLDFGLIKITKSDQLRLTSSATVFGTPLYMSPEQIMSSTKVDARTDQHAMAMVLFELLTKQPPYYDESPTAVTVKIATLAPPSLRALRPDAPAQLDAILVKALAKAPEQRFEDIACFALAIAPFGTERAQSAARKAAAALNRPAVVPEVTLPTSAVTGTETVSGLSTMRRLDVKRSRRFGVVAVGAAALLGVGGAVLGYGLMTAPSSGSRSGDPTAAVPEASPVPTAEATDTPSAMEPRIEPSAPPPTPSASSPAPSASVESAPPITAGKPKPRPPSPSAGPPTAAPTSTEFIPVYKNPADPKK
jgi:serine/threonine-protein kinase